jgi:hypothetical protein
MSEDRTLIGDHDERASGITHLSPMKPKAYPLRRQRGVQTDDWTGSLFPGSAPPFSDISSSLSPNDGLSESSSLTDNPTSLGSLLDRVAQLFSRITQTDALTLTTRLKRQNIVGADVSYISRSNVEAIVSDVANLRNSLRGALEDEKFTTICTRKDLRATLKLFRDIFRELGTLRITLNDIVLDPSLAPKIRDMVFNPKDESQASNKGAIGGGWIAPLTKLFGGSSSTPQPAPQRSISGATPVRPPVRPVPKAAAAHSASATTVNVEFSGVGVGRAIADSLPRSSPGPSNPETGIAAPTPNRQASQTLMGIFAGAPRAESGTDPWVVVKAASKLRPKTPGTTSAKKSVHSQDSESRQSKVNTTRNLDAMIDMPTGEVNDESNSPLLERTLRSRGLSDSSIRATYSQHGEKPPQIVGPSGRQTSAFGAFTQKFSELVAGSSSAEAGNSGGESGGRSGTKHRRTASGLETLPRTFSPQLARLLAWDTPEDDLDTRTGDMEPYAGTLRQRNDALGWPHGARTRDM